MFEVKLNNQLLRCVIDKCPIKPRHEGIRVLPCHDDKFNNWVVCVIQKDSLVFNELRVIRDFHRLQKFNVNKTGWVDPGNSGFWPLLLFLGSCNLLFDFVECEVFGDVANKIYVH